MVGVTVKNLRMLFFKTKKLSREERLNILRAFLDNHFDDACRVRLLRVKAIVRENLESDMEFLQPAQRFLLYTLVEVLYPKNAREFLQNRLTRESDAKCLEVIQAILEISKSRIDTSIPKR